MAAAALEIVVWHVQNLYATAEIFQAQPLQISLVAATVAAVGLAAVACGTAAPSVAEIVAHRLALPAAEIHSQLLLTTWLTQPYAL